MSCHGPCVRLSLGLMAWLGIMTGMWSGTCPSLAAAQSLPAGITSPVTPEPFDSATAVLVLESGLLVVVDPRARQVYTVNPRTGVRQPLGRRGEGPGEYRGPRGAYRLRDNTVAIYDGDLRRFVLFDREGRPAGMLTPPQNLIFGAPVGSDTVGAGALYLVLRLPAGRPPVFPDSGTVVRWSLGGEVTTVATLRFPPVVSTMRQVGTRTNMVLRSNAFDFSDTPIVALTGSVQVLRGEPYRLDRIQSGTVVRGPDLPGARLEISPRDLEEFRVRADGEYPWRMKAAVREGTAILQNDSIVWAARHGPAGAATVSWDLLSTSGVRIGTRTLPAAYRVAGFAPDGEVYVWRRDADDLQWLERLVPQRP